MIFIIMIVIMCFTLTYNPNNLNAQTQSWKPQGRLTIILSSYGGAFDLTARQLAQVLPDFLGQSIVVQAITGAEGANALDFLQKSKPDGRMMTLIGMGPYITLSVKKQYPWDVKDLPIVLAIDTPPYAVYTSTKSPYSNYQDLLKVKRDVRIGIGGTNFSILPMLLDLEKNGIQYKVARFKGSAEANLAVIAGDADLTIGALSGVNTDKIRSGDFRALYVLDTKRFPLIPNAPTHAELGMPKEWANYRLMRLIQVAPGTPEHIQKGLKEAIIKGLKDKRTLEWSVKVDTPVDIMTEEEWMERIRFVVEGFKNNPKIVEGYF
jgi:tripartite-type tricarboxylate transporter receptor subunit TctC